MNFLSSVTRLPRPRPLDVWGSPWQPLVSWDSDRAELHHLCLHKCLTLCGSAGTEPSAFRTGPKNWKPQNRPEPSPAESKEFLVKEKPRQMCRPWTRSDGASITGAKVGGKRTWALIGRWGHHSPAALGFRNFKENFGPPSGPSELSFHHLFVF